MYALLDSNRPRAKKADLKDLITAALCASESKGYEDCLEDIQKIRDNTTLGE